MGDLVPEKKAKKLKSSIANDALHAVSGIGRPTSSPTMAQVQSAIMAHQAKQKADLLTNWGALAGQFIPPKNIVLEPKSPMTATEIAQRHIDAMTQTMIEKMHMAANPQMILRDPQAAQISDDMSRAED